MINFLLKYKGYYWLLVVAMALVFVPAFKQEIVDLLNLPFKTEYSIYILTLHYIALLSLHVSYTLIDKKMGIIKDIWIFLIMGVYYDVFQYIISFTSIIISTKWDWLALYVFIGYLAFKYVRPYERFKTWFKK